MDYNRERVGRALNSITSCLTWFCGWSFDGIFLPERHLRERWIFQDYFIVLLSFHVIPMTRTGVVNSWHVPQLEYDYSSWREWLTLIKALPPTMVSPDSGIGQRTTASSLLLSPATLPSPAQSPCSGMRWNDHVSPWRHQRRRLKPWPH